MFIPVATLEAIESADDRMVCVFCDREVGDLPYCPACGEYKGLMTVTEWQEYTGEVWS